MKIAIDIDDTIANTNELLYVYADKYDKLYKEGHGVIDKNCYEFNGMYDWTLEDRQHFLETYMVEVFENVEVKENVRDVISNLRKDGHKIIFITTRDEEFIKDSYGLTKTWLDKNNIEYDMIISGDKRKSDYVEIVGFELFIDNSVKNCTKVSEKGVESLLFDTIYNRDCLDFRRFDNWLDIYNYISSKNS